MANHEPDRFVESVIEDMRGDHPGCRAAYTEKLASFIELRTDEYMGNAAVIVIHPKMKEFIVSAYDRWTAIWVESPAAKNYFSEWSPIWAITHGCIEDVKKMNAYSPTNDSYYGFPDSVLVLIDAIMEEGQKCRPIQMMCQAVFNKTSRRYPFKTT
jgi:hypothetical protein